MPSVLGVLAAGYFLYRLTESIVGAGTGYLAVIPFFSASAVILGATYARPYGLALAAATGCGWKFYEFLKSPTRANFVQYLALSILVLYFQYFFGFLLALQFAFAIYWRIRGNRLPAIFFATPIIWLLALLPVRESIETLLTFSRGAYAPPVAPTFAQFFLLTLPLGPLLAGAVGIVAIAFAFPRSFKPRFDWPAGSLALMVAWLFAVPVFFFALARLTPYNLFATRYLLFVTPAFFVLLASFIAWIPATHHRLLVLFAILGGTVLHPGNLLQVYAGPAASPQEDWRATMKTVQAAPGNPPVFIRSGIAESNRLDWQNGTNPNSFILAPLAAYPVKNPVIALPFQLTPEVQQFVDAKLAGDLMNSPTILLVSDSNAEITSWMQQQMKARGYAVHLTEQSTYTIASYTIASLGRGN